MPPKSASSRWPASKEISWGWNKRVDAISGILDDGGDFGRQKPSSPIYGKVTLPMCSAPLRTTVGGILQGESERHLENTRLGYAVNALDDHIRTKLTPTIVDHMSKVPASPSLQGSAMRFRANFNVSWAILIDASQKRMEPLRKFCESVGQAHEAVPERGVALLNHLAGLSR